MKHTKKKLSKIVDELLNYFFHIGSTNISINIQEQDEQYEITFKCNYNEETNEAIIQLCKCLNNDRNEQVECYYWELAGESETHTELSLIGMMIDNFLLEYDEGMLELKLFRKK